MTDKFKITYHNYSSCNVERILIFLFILFNFACDDEKFTPDTIDLPVTYYFVKSEFMGNTECFDTLGIRINSMTPSFVKNDFLFYDGSAYPFESIKISIDSSVSFTYTIRELNHTDDGQVISEGDTLYFFSTESSYSRLLFKGYIKDQILRIPAYGYKMVYDYGTGSGWSGNTEFGNPDIGNLIYLMNEYSSENYISLYVQKFELTYEKKSK
jgi:signal peptidase I